MTALLSRLTAPLFPAVDLPWIDGWTVSVAGLLGAAVAVLVAGVVWNGHTRAVAYFRRRAGQWDTAVVLALVVLRITLTALVLIAALDAVNLASTRAVIDTVAGFLDFKLGHIGDTELTPSNLLVFAGLVAGSVWGSSIVRRLVARSLSEQGIDTEGTIGVVLNLGQYALAIIGGLAALETLGFGLTSLFTAGAALFVGLGFALQSVAQNFVSGVILLVEGAIKPGDVLEVEGRMVRVKRMGIRSTVVRTLDDDDMIVPNTVLAQGTVRNLTFLDDSVRVSGAVGVTYGTDLDAVWEALEAAGSGVPHTVDRPPLVLLTGYGNSSIDFEVFVWTDDPWAIPRIRSQLLRNIWREFATRDVVIPFPQVDVHADPELLEALGRRGS